MYGCASGPGPGRTRLVDKRSAADHAVGISERVGIFVCELGSFRRRGWGDRRMEVRLRRMGMLEIEAFGTVSNEGRSN